MTTSAARVVVMRRERRLQVSASIIASRHGRRAVCPLSSDPIPYERSAVSGSRCPFLSRVCSFCSCGARALRSDGGGRALRRLRRLGPGIVGPSSICSRPNAEGHHITASSSTSTDVPTYRIALVVATGLSTRHDPPAENARRVMFMTLRTRPTPCKDPPHRRYSDEASRG